MLKPLFRLMTELSSRKAVSRITGKMAKSSLSRKLIPKFASIYGIRFEEAEKPIEQYTTLNEFFTRRLKPGIRLLEGDDEHVISPVDAVITGMGAIKEGLLVNVKGQDYSLEELLNHAPRRIHYTHGFYFVLYLSPTDYHRIHAPITGHIVEKDHIAGRVYPVNEFGLRHMRKVLSRNERLITYIKHIRGEVAVVKVGAMNVSSIQYVDPLPELIERGAELAFFEFGSTVVLLLENYTFQVNPKLMVNSKVQQGVSLGIWQRQIKKGG